MGCATSFQAVPPKTDPAVSQGQFTESFAADSVQVLIFELTEYSEKALQRYYSELQITCYALNA